ncbi:MAG: ATP synthase F1 subunit delta [Patescibacteria group bacterium]|nr:ATP synthase F1 subunit delta [Patescibacteria group bacterium]MDD5490438.1 ATP synthase F1 subunit delta [Patescibacteria group bacterium]
MRYSPKQYAAVFYDLTKDKKGKELGENIRNFLMFLSKHNDFKKLPAIIAEFTKLSDKRNGLVRAEVATARALSAKNRAGIIKGIKKTTGNREVLLQEKRDDLLLGGVRILAGDKLLDGSFKNKILSLRKKLS